MRHWSIISATAAEYSSSSTMIQVPAHLGTSLEEVACKEPKAFDGRLGKPPADALCPIIPCSTCILCLTAAASTKLVDAFSLDTVIASPGKEVNDPWAFYLPCGIAPSGFRPLRILSTCSMNKNKKLGMGKNHVLSFHHM
ncbi:hypothetical protein AMTRI_Chr10g229560 [Amborella trichopoda]